MKRFLFLMTVFFALLSGSLVADSTIISFAPNDGSGRNFGFYQQIGGTTIGIGGGTSPDVFNIYGYLPGSTLGGGGPWTVYFYSAFIVSDGVVEGIDFDSNGSLFMSSIQLPTNGALKATLPVSLDFFASGATADTGRSIGINDSDRGKITFTLDLSDGRYYAGNFEPIITPEPGTFGLIVTGLLGFAGFARRKRLH